MPIKYDYDFERGESESIGIIIRELDENGKAKLPTFTITDQKVTIYSCNDLETALIGPDTNVIEGALTNAKTLNYILDTSILEAGSYLAKFEYNRDNFRKRIKTIRVRIKALSC